MCYETLTDNMNGGVKATKMKLFKVEECNLTFTISAREEGGKS